MGRSVTDPEGVQWVRVNPPLRQNYFIFMQYFQKNQEQSINNQVKLKNRTPLYKFEPPIKNPCRPRSEYEEAV